MIPREELDTLPYYPETIVMIQQDNAYSIVGLEHAQVKIKTKVRIKRKCTWYVVAVIRYGPYKTYEEFHEVFDIFYKECYMVQQLYIASPKEKDNLQISEEERLRKLMV